MRSRLLVPVTAVACTLFLAGCGALTDSSEGAEDSRTVAVGLYPLEYVAARVAGDAFEVENLTTPGGEPHDLTLDVRETAIVADSALLVYVGSLQPSVQEAAEQVAEGEVLDVATVVDLLPFEDGHEHEEHADHDHAEEHADEESTTTVTPRRSRPTRRATRATTTARTTPTSGTTRSGWPTSATRSPTGSPTSTPTAPRTSRPTPPTCAPTSRRSTRSTPPGLAQCATSTVVTNHDAFGYLEKYGLHLESITGITPDAEPTPAALADLQDLIESDGITTVFSESLVSPKAAETLASDAGVRTEVLDTVEDSPTRPRTRTTFLSCARTSRSSSRRTAVDRSAPARDRGSPTVPSPSRADRCCARSTSRCAPASS